MPTINELLSCALTALEGHSPSPRLDGEVLLAHALEETRTYLRAWPERRVEADLHTRFQALVARRAGGEPVAYLTGEREFWSLRLEVTADTLIPRAETERLVEVALGLMATERSLTVADLGTGSGAVAAAIASERPDCHVIATDVCPRALAVARRNMTRLGLRNVSLRQGHWCAALAAERCALIVCNPPYVASGDRHLQQGDLRFEPRQALAAGSDGLDDIGVIAACAAAHLLPGAPLVLEHGHDQGAAVRALLRQHGFQEVRGVRDLGGNDRVVVGRVA